MHNVLVSGACGQDGSLLCKKYLEDGYKVYGIKRRSSSSNTARLKNILNNKNFELIEGDITDSIFVSDLFRKIKPKLFFNMAAMSHVHTSFSMPAYTFQVNAVGVLYCLEAIRNNSPSTRMLQASTSEMMGSNYSVGDDGSKYQDENTPLCANSPYACAKLAAHNLVRLYREAYNVFACCAITFNHEQPGLRGKEFVTRKISLYVAKLNEFLKEFDGVLRFDNDYIYVGDKQFPKLRLGNINAYRDWMCAEDAINAFDLMIHNSKPIDYVISSDTTHTVKEFCELAFRVIGIDNYMDYIVIDPKYMRPMEVNYLCGNSSKIRKELGWSPKVSFEELVFRMVMCDIKNNGVV